jgi:anti-sigma factor RsiW
MTDAPHDDPTLLLQAALDGELDAAGMIDVEARLAADPALAAEYARLVALRDAIRTRIPRPGAPDALRARVIAMAQAPAQSQRAAQSPAERRPLRPLGAPYRSLAASLMLGVLLGAGAYGLFAPSPADDVQRAIVAGFIRGRLSGQTVDVATSDRHTVKPWLAAKIAGATTVVDLKADGFPLVGGRIDVVGGTPVPTLVYQRREHQIALSEMPALNGASSAPRRATRDGYSLLEWTDEGRLFAAVSDMPPGELDAFAEAFRRAAAAEREETPKPP